MHAHVGDWLVIPPAPHEAHGRRGQIVKLVHPDGTAPYRVRWLEDEHVSLVFPPPDARLQNGRTQPIVLVAVDGSASSLQAARWAAGLHLHSRSSLRLVHVVDGAAEEAGEHPEWLRELSADLKKSGMGNTVDVVAAAEVDSELERLRHEADLVVLGSYGDGAGCGMRVGHTALALLDDATCPVAIVRGREQRSPIPDYGVVAVGADGSTESIAALELAAELAEGWEATLLVLHTWCDAFGEPGQGVRRLPEAWDRMAGDAAALLATAVHTVQAAHPELDIDQRVVADEPLNALLDVAAGARLVVVGSRGTRSTPGTAMCSTSRGLVEFAPCPVLVVGPRAAHRARRLGTAHAGVG